jgi:hypothetical protein
MNTLSRVILTAALLATLSARAQQDTATMEIGVRSGVDTGEDSKRRHDPTYAEDITRHANIYLLASVLPHPSIMPLVKPVDAIAIAKDLNRLLVTLGFHPVQADQKPEIVITVEYGRGWLPNPYNDNNFGKVHNNLTDSDPLSAWPLHEIFFSLSTKVKEESMEEEKLIIQVKAWKYSPDPKQKLKLLWMTTMEVDDPDHRDLNEIYQKLLAAGAPHFDHPIDREHEVVINTAVPEGHVKVGRPEVIDDFKSR